MTSEESRSPRGRIDAMRAIEWSGAPIDDAFVEFLDTCVQCRGCEPACPSGVPYGQLAERAKATLAREGKVTPWWQRLAYRALGHHRVLLAGSSALALAQRARVFPRRLGLPDVPLRRGPSPRSSLPPTEQPDVWLYVGCVMDAWMRPTHRATAALIEATGATWRPVPSSAGCCGALHVHAGLADEAKHLARQTIEAVPSDAVVVVNSAGCGAALKDYGHLVGTSEAAAFASRVRDVHEWLAERVDLLPPATGERGAVIVQDPCHLRHVQRSHLAVRTVLGRYVDLVELDDDGMCCGAGGAFSALQPELAGEIRDRKVGAIDRAAGRSGASVVASANPGCAMHLGALGLDVRHPIDLVAAAAGLTQESQ